MTAEKCSICKCWEAKKAIVVQDLPNQARCRRYPPQLFQEFRQVGAVAVADPARHFLYTFADEWCGEWRHK